MAIWLERYDVALEAHVAANKLSFAQIAMALNLEFRTNFTRCAAIGRASRLGLIAKKRPGEVHTPQPYTWRTRAERRATATPRPEGWKPRQPAAKPLSESPALYCVETTSRNIPFGETGPNDCMWTDSKGAVSDFLFCGNPKFIYRRGDVDVTSSYCRKHFERSIGGGTTSERRATHGVAA